MPRVGDEVIVTYMEVNGMEFIDEPGVITHISTNKEKDYYHISLNDYLRYFTLYENEFTVKENNMGNDILKEML